jgi:hypothetical protein
LDSGRRSSETEAWMLVIAPTIINMVGGRFLEK